MRRSIERLALAFAIPAALAAAAALPAQQEATRTDHATRIQSLSSQLRWHDAQGQKQYTAAKEDVTNALFKEIDSYISDTFAPVSSSAQQIQDGLDKTLGIKNGDIGHNTAFLTNFADGTYLIVGVELWRGGDAINQDAVSFRAYKEAGDKFECVTSIEALTGTSDAVTDPPLVDLHAQALKAPPVAGEFWFLAWADVPPLAPPTVAMRLYAFDGKKFRTVWSPDNVITASVENAVGVASNGDIVINRMPDFQSQIILHQQYSVTADGPQKIAEWTTPRE